MNEKEVIRALKSERCPPSVLKQVQARIRSEGSPSAWRHGIPVGISVVMVVLLSLIFINIRDDSIVTEENAANHDLAASMDGAVPATAPVDDYMAEAEELKLAFTYIGLTLREEAERNRDVILRSTVPVVRDSIENTEEFINNKTKGKISL